MKLLFWLIVALGISLFTAFGAPAQQYRSLGIHDGVEVMASIDPLGPNNQIAANVKFVNRNGYKVDITWRPLITCEGQPEKEGYGAPFSMDAAASYEVRIWRSSACALGPIEGLKVHMEVKKAGF